MGALPSEAGISRVNARLILYSGGSMSTNENKLDFYYVDKKYIRDLSNADDKVLSVSPQAGKETRPFVGIVVIMGTKEYCIPLTSPKSKFDTKTHEDFIKIPDPKKKNSNGAALTIGILNINNMIPISEIYLQKVDLSEKSGIDNTRRMLLVKQLRWCRDNYDLISRKANKLYSKVINNPEKDRNLVRRCCDFKKLERVLERRLTPSQNQNEQFEHCKKVINRTNAILNSNPKLKSDFITAKKEFEQKQTQAANKEKNIQSNNGIKTNPQNKHNKR